MPGFWPLARREWGAYPQRPVTGPKRSQKVKVAERLWILASYEVAGRASKEFVRPEGTPDFRRPGRTDSALLEILEFALASWVGLAFAGNAATVVA